MKKIILLSAAAAVLLCSCGYTSSQASGEGTDIIDESAFDPTDTEPPEQDNAEFHGFWVTSEETDMIEDNTAAPTDTETSEQDNAEFHGFWVTSEETDMIEDNTTAPTDIGATEQDNAELPDTQDPITKTDKIDESTAAQTDLLPIVQDNDEISELREKIENHLALFEYGKAVQLIEENKQLCADPSFDKAKTRLLIHYTEVAKSYHSKTATFITRQETLGNDVKSMLDANGRLSVSYLSDLLTYEEETALDRVTISCFSDQDHMDIGVSVEIFGTRAVYPAEDIALDPVTAPVGGYTNADLLLEDVETNIAIYRYAAAVRLIEENPQLSSDPSFEDVKAQLLKYFTEKAKLFYTNTLTYVTVQEVYGYPLTAGCEGYDRKSSTLDPACLSKLLTPAETAVLSRVRIICTNEDIAEFKITIDFCGMTAYYPANDVKI